MAGENQPGDRVNNSETIRILPKKVDVSSSDVSPNENQQSDENKRESLVASTTNISIRRKQSSQTLKEHYCENAYYNNGFQLSPSDLERSWKLRKASENDSQTSTLRRTKSECKISIQRSPIDFSYIDQKYGSTPAQTSYQRAKTYLHSKCVCNVACIISFITSIFPVLSWLPKYRKEYIIPDLVAGFTISILHIPQGMAYGVLAAVNAENGLYVSFFPVIIYFLLGTSRHISIGTFAVISLMLSSAVYGRDSVFTRDLNETNQTIFNNSLESSEIYAPTHLEIVTTLAIGVGFCQIFMGIFNLGALTVVLSDQLVSGFTTGAATHVAVSQMKDIFGIHIGRYSGSLKLIYMLRDIFENLIHTNSATIIISAIAILALAVYKEQIDKRIKAKLPIPIPIDLIVVILATIASYYGKFNATYKVSVIKDIPTGLPYPNPPRLDLLSSLIGDSIAIAVVAFAISLSMAKLFAKKNKYVVRPNQELFALGWANIFSSFFACYPCSASLSRSLVQEKSGGKTQVAGIVSCCILLIVLLALAPTFYHLPKCILSCVIIIALKPMFIQVKDFVKAWRISKLDALIWLFTFLSTVLLDVTYGLLVGVIFSLMSVIIRTVIPSKTFLGRIPDTDIYLDIKRYHVAEEIEGIKIFHFESALYFINREMFKSYLLKHVPINEVAIENGVSSKKAKTHRIIIDCSTFTFVDLSGLEMLLEIMKEYQDVGISVFLSGCSVAMHQVMDLAKFNERVPLHPSIFPTIHDAVEYHYLPH